MEYSFINEMSTTTRHNHLLSSFLLDIGALFKKKELFPLKESCSLVFEGKKMSGEETLVDVESIENIDEFVSFTINGLNFVQPDFLLFQHNKFLQDPNKLKTAGIPDLIVEVWSPFNKPHEKEMKFRLYSSHPSCEHWYIDQNSNLVTCFKGKQQLPNQYLSKVLETTMGLKFDLTHMSL